jgi:hypothetical protein
MVVDSSLSTKIRKGHRRMTVDVDVYEQKCTDVKLATLFYFQFSGKQQLGMKASIKETRKTATVILTDSPWPQAPFPALLPADVIQGTVLVMPTAVFRPRMDATAIQANSADHREAGVLGFMGSRKLLRCVTDLKVCEVDLESDVAYPPTSVNFWVKKWSIELVNHDRDHFEKLLEWS